MIAHKYKCIFVHIPKCVGTSIEDALGHFDDHVGRGGQDHRSIRMIESLSCKSIFSKSNRSELIRRLRYRNRKVLNPNNKIIVTKQQYQDYFKFTVVRNPWARAYSWYQNVMRDKYHRETHKITEDMSLNEFLKKYAGKGILKPQIDYLKEFNGNINMDYIIHFENLSEEFNNVTKLMNIPNITLPHKIKGSTENFQKEYDEDSKKIIETIYKEEIEMFGYSFPSGQYL